MFDVYQYTSGSPSVLGQINISSSDLINRQLLIQMWPGAEYDMKNTQLAAPQSTEWYIYRRAETEKSIFTAQTLKQAAYSAFINSRNEFSLLFSICATHILVYPYLMNKQRYVTRLLSYVPTTREVSDTRCVTKFITKLITLTQFMIIPTIFCILIILF